MPLFIPEDDEAKRCWEPGVRCDARRFPERQLSRTTLPYTGKTLHSGWRL
jgi:hypothetical protein